MIENAIQVPGALLRVRQYGENSGQTFILLHGGPGMVGYMGPIGGSLADLGRVVDYDQRGAFESPSTGPFLMQNHVEDLKYLVELLCKDTECILVGHSWGAILGLAFCAQNPKIFKRLILIGCGPLDQATREAMAKNIDQRLNPWERETIDRLRATLADDSIDFETRVQNDLEFLKIITPVYQFDRNSLNGFLFSRRNLKPSYECGDDYSTTRNSGDLLRSLKLVKTPVVAIHGKEDVIPYKMIVSTLMGNMDPAPRIFVMDQSGHMPWLEENSRTHFFSILRSVV